jgi:hypothetical protein
VDSDEHCVVTEADMGLSTSICTIVTLRCKNTVSTGNTLIFVWTFFVVSLFDKSLKSKSGVPAKMVTLIHTDYTKKEKKKEKEKERKLKQAKI